MADISKGATFTDGDPTEGIVNGTRLNALVDSATILPAFVSGKPTTTPVLADRALLYDTSGTALIAPTLTDVFAAQVVNATALTPSLRSLGNTATTAAQGDLVAFLAQSQTFTAAMTKLKHVGFVASGSGTTIAADTGMVTPTVLTVTGCDNFGRIDITPATTTSTNANICVITFGVAFGTTPVIGLIPYGANAIGAQGSTKLIQTGTETAASFKLTSGAAGLTGTVNYKFIYFCFPTS